jgi:uncharacterized protein YndB with AHSA1/START domain
VNQPTPDNTFKVVVEREMDAPIEVVLDAVTQHTSGWLWPTDFPALQASTQPEEGVITVWDPPHRYANRMDGDGGFFNVLDYTLTDIGDGRSRLRYIHHGVNLDPDHNQEDAVQQHTDFYLHTLNEYVPDSTPRSSTCRRRRNPRRREPSRSSAPASASPPRPRSATPSR